MNFNPFFIVGVQRSGTTLLRLLLNAHSEIAIPEEASFLKPLLKTKWTRTPISGEKKEKLVNYLRKNEQFILWNFDREPLLREIENKESTTIKEIMEIMYSAYAAHENKSSWGDKSLFFGAMDLIYEMFPNAKFIHIVRDGRDVFFSWRKMDANKSHPTVMALDWKFKIRFIEKSMKNIPSSSMKIIRYEDLLDKPEEILRETCKFLDIEFEESMLAFHQSSNKYIGKHHSDLIFKKIDKSNSNKWKVLLTATETKLYQMIAAKTLKKYGYELMDKRLSLKHIFLFIKDIIIGLPKRIIELIKVRLAFRRAIYKGEATKTITVGELPEGKYSK
ncbi:sulfotransferase [Psychroserpens sp. SPM9]|uniref:sulfotransferase family protein n=1 Tax=Psychroserpens sp. SPM9 TaxID=2975598 RepID=UPI0021A5748C|nr:sulfotransferase [Psychroserpens sp. SPM9]MDG5491105.1 sulfotransferase [Psychroserpens sp. SPM9]